MEILNIIVQFLILLGILVLFFAFRSYYPKYFQTKGANQATKEDIGAITKIVEQIKTDLSERTEYIKAQLSLTNQHKLGFAEAEREAFFEYNRKLNLRLYHLVRFSARGYYINNYNDLSNFFAEIDIRQIEFDIAEAHLDLFYRDKEFKELNKRLTLEILKYEKIISDLIFDLQVLFAEAFYNIKRSPEKELGITKETNAAQRKLLGEAGKMRNAQIKSIYSLQAEMMEVIYGRLSVIEHAIEELSNTDGD
jgi:hypothetical protein